MSSEANVAKAGLEGVVAAQSSLSDVNGEEGKLIYAGYDINDLAKHASFEEVIYLLWKGKLPTTSELDQLKSQLNNETRLPAEIIELISAIPKTANPMEMLRTVVSALGHYDPDGADMSLEANVRKAVRLTAKFPTIVTTFQRVRNGQQPVQPHEELAPGRVEGCVHLGLVVEDEPAIEVRSIDDRRSRELDVVAHGVAERVAYELAEGARVAGGGACGR